MAEATGNNPGFFQQFQNMMPFGNKAPQTPPQNPAPQNQPPQMPPQNQTVSPEGNTKGNDPNQMQNPIDAFKGMWDAPQDDGTNRPPEFNINPEVMQRVTSGFDFSQGLPEELSAKFQSGEAFSNQEIFQLMSHVGRAAYSNAMNHQSKLTEKFIGVHGEHSLKNLPKLLKQHMTTQSVRRLSAAQSNPAVGEHMERIAAQLSQKYPNAPEEWIADQTKNYFLEMARAVSPDSFNQEGPGTRQLPKEVDWDAFMQSGPQN